MNKQVVYKVGQIIKNKRTKLVRRVAKVSKGVVSWISKDGKKKGSCESSEITRWIAGNDLH